MNKLIILEGEEYDYTGEFSYLVEDEKKRRFWVDATDVV